MLFQLAYTQVLQGSIDLAKLVFPTNVLGILLVVKILNKYFN